MDRIIYEANSPQAENLDDFWQFMGRVGKKAEENGLTEELLTDLLNEDQ